MPWRDIIALVLSHLSVCISSVLPGVRIASAVCLRYVV